MLAVCKCLLCVKAAAGEAGKNSSSRGAGWQSSRTSRTSRVAAAVAAAIAEAVAVAVARGVVVVVVVGGEEGALIQTKQKRAGREQRNKDYSQGQNRNNTFQSDTPAGRRISKYHG